MQTILSEISKKALLLNDFDFTQEQITAVWLGTTPASEEAIVNTEQRLNFKLPEDYRTFLKISNGFAQPSAISCSLMPVEQIGFLRDFDEDLIEIWSGMGIAELQEVSEALAAAILIGGFEEDQYLLLIPPDNRTTDWQYWKFATWMSEEKRFASLTGYLQDDLSFLNDQTKDLMEPIPRAVQDYSLRDAVFGLNWNQVYELTTSFISDTKTFSYYNGLTDLFKLALLSAAKINRFDAFVNFITRLNTQGSSAFNDEGFHLKMRYQLEKYERAAKEQMSFVPEFQQKGFEIRSNPMTLNAIENQIAEVRPDLLKEKKKTARLEYQLYFLYEYGSAKDFMKIYEQHLSVLSLETHLRAAFIYAKLNELRDAKSAVHRYFTHAMDYRPFEPFFHESLLPILDADLLRTEGSGPAS